MTKKEQKEIILANNVVFLAKDEAEFKIIAQWYKDKGFKVSDYKSYNVIDNSTFCYFGVLGRGLTAWSLRSTLEHNAKRMELIESKVIHPNLPYYFYDDDNKENPDEGVFLNYTKGLDYPYQAAEENGSVDTYEYIKEIPIEEEIEIETISPATTKQLELFLIKVGNQWKLKTDVDKLKSYTVK